MKIKRQSWLIVPILAILMSGLVLGGCNTQPEASSDSAKDAITDQTPVVTAQESDPTMNELPRLEGKATVELVVNGSPIVIEVDGNNAPVSAGNFVDLVERGVYDGLVFHRVVKQPQPFVAQGGDPQGKDPNFPVNRLGTGGFVDPETGQRRFIPLEITPQDGDEPIYGKTLSQAGISASPALQHTRGAVAMARSQMPNSASSQFYIALADLEFLDGDYAVFGYVTEGMDVVDQIAQGDRIESAKVTAGAENLQK